MDRKKAALIGGVVTAAALITSYLVLSYMITIPTTGIIASADIKIYATPSTSIPLTSIDWGIVYPNSSVTKILYIKNVGTLNITISIYADNFNPPEFMVMTVSSNVTQEILWHPQDIKPVAVTLSAPSNVPSETFTFDLIVTSFERD